MTELKRKGITQKIFLAQKNVDDKSGYTNALVTVSDEIDNDAANREDLVGNENIIANAALKEMYLNTPTPGK